MNADVSAQKLEIEDLKHNFGFVNEGDTVTYEFKFKNTGVNPLVFSGYEVECHCTTLEMPSKPVLPGETGFLKLSFDTHNKMDRQDRTVLVLTNAINSPLSLRFKAVVRPVKKKS
jgi:hypothetical protein